MRGKKVILSLVTRGVARKGDFGLYEGAYEPLHDDNFGVRIAELPWPVYRPTTPRRRRGKSRATAGRGSDAL